MFKLAISAALALTAVEADNYVTSLTYDNFDNILRQKKNGNGTFVKFFAPWCGHCKAIAPKWEEFAAFHGKNINVGQVDCTEHNNLCHSYKIQGYPTLIWFPIEENHRKVWYEYRGQHTVEDWLSYAKHDYNDWSDIISSDFTDEL